MVEHPNVEIAEEPPAPPPRHGGFWRPLAIRDFRLLWLGESTSLLGDQFYLLALPWLTLQLTGSGLALGTVLMVASVPRLIFMLVGGALTDRFSPRALMLLSNAVRGLLVGALAVLLFAGALTLWMLYLCSFVFGLIDAFFHPAMLSIVPRLVPRDDLEPSNALIQGTGQISESVGPALAGLLLAAGGGAAAFAIDAATFVFATVALLLMRPGTPTAERPPAEEHAGLLASIGGGLRSMWADPTLRVFLLLIVVVNFCLIGPVTVGVPALAAFRFQGNAAAFGAMLTALGVGALIGTALAGALRAPNRLGIALAGIAGALAACLVGLGLAPSVALAIGLLALMGAASSFLNIHIISWLQRRSPPELLGRVMSVVMLAVFGLDPLSRVVAGFAVDLSTPALFVAAGTLLALIALGAAMARATREIG